jgi:hypothetical protein
LDLERAEWGFLLLWILASTVGVAVGLAVGLGVSWALSKLVNWWEFGPAGEVVGWALFGAVAGAVVGTAQWIVLRKRVHRCGGWVFASAVGWAVCVAVGVVVNGRIGFLVATGTVVGTAQWLVLRKRIYRSGWWVLTSAVGWAVFIAVGYTVVLSTTMFGALGVGVGLTAGYAVGGTLTGYVLTRLIRHPILVEQEAMLA